MIIGQIEREDLVAVETVSAYQTIGRERAQAKSHSKAKCSEHKSLLKIPTRKNLKTKLVRNFNRSVWQF